LARSSSGVESGGVDGFLAVGRGCRDAFDEDQSLSRCGGQFVHDHGHGGGNGSEGKSEVRQRDGSCAGDAVAHVVDPGPADRVGLVGVFQLSHVVGEQDAEATFDGVGQQSDVLPRQETVGAFSPCGAHPALGVGVRSGCSRPDPRVRGEHSAGSSCAHVVGDGGRGGGRPRRSLRQRAARSGW
jgi:hypothetical protein